MIPSGKASHSAKISKPWWQRGVFSTDNGFGRWFQKIISRFLRTKEMVPEEALFAHRQASTDIAVFGKSMDILHKEEFLCNEEFCILVKLRYLLDNGIEEYSDINESIQLLQAAINAKDSFVIIDQTESRFRGAKQQQFYQFVEELLNDFTTTEHFQDTLDKQLKETLVQIKTEEGQLALKNYTKQLQKLAERPLALKLLSLFKSYNLADYSLLRQISELVQQLSKRDIRDYQSLRPLIMANYSAFESLGKIISLPGYRSNPDTFMRITQVLTLDYKYQLPFAQLTNLLMVIKRWYQPYQNIIAIREQYPPHRYQQPSDFEAPIAGEATFFRYKNWLTEKTTGVLFLDLGQKV
ncbi:MULTISPECIES: hypothetical protein [unclassified Synechocystis]|uniref:hypothetical protein n=1 Tax=unclassified Synechocystis TaxID=2640012 RepID=UPI0004074007|nr:MULTISPECIES: hypothetical protein [unclassified Synechocystis]AIE74248.1 hypothetical protein D082_17200 [Synechocystis sp. PCC 6714]MCT0252875.1 ELKS/Rab6-interacting/CAST family protein [Synechocystis sp. CS-94]